MQIDLLAFQLSLMNCSYLLAKPTIPLNETSYDTIIFFFCKSDITHFVKVAYSLFFFFLFETSVLNFYCQCDDYNITIVRQF